MRDRIRVFQQVASIICVLAARAIFLAGANCGSRRTRPLLSAGQLQDLAAPIALYPDPLARADAGGVVVSRGGCRSGSMVATEFRLTGEALVQAAAAEN